MKVFIVIEWSTSDPSFRINDVYARQEKAEGVAAAMIGTVHCGGDDDREVVVGEVVEFELVE